MVEEVYLSDLHWTKLHDNIGGLTGKIIFKESISYEDFCKLPINDYCILCSKDYINELHEHIEELENENLSLISFIQERD